MTDLFDTAAPAPVSDGLPYWQPKKFFNTETEKGQLLLFEVSHVQKEEGIDKEKGEVDHVYGKVTALTGPKAGETFSLRLSAAKLVAQLKGKSGKRVVGRLGQQATTKGNPAWVLETEVSDADRQIAVDFLAKRDDPPF